MDLFEALKECGFTQIVGDEKPSGEVEYVVTVHRAEQGVMYDVLDNRDALNAASDAVMRLQKFLVTRGYYSGSVDGIIDDGYSRTIYALQRYLADCEWYSGLYDGRLDAFSSSTISALQGILGVSVTGHVTKALVDAMCKM